MNALALSAEPSSGTSGAQYLSAISLAAGSNNINSPAAPNDGDILAILLTTPGSGVASISWAAAFKLVTDNDFDSRSGKTNAYIFVGCGGNWYLVSMILGRPGQP